MRHIPSRPGRQLSRWGPLVVPMSEVPLLSALYTAFRFHAGLASAATRRIQGDRRGHAGMYSQGAPAPWGGGRWVGDGPTSPCRSRGRRSGTIGCRGVDGWEHRRNGAVRHRRTPSIRSLAEAPGSWGPSANRPPTPASRALRFIAPAALFAQTLSESARCCRSNGGGRSPPFPPLPAREPRGRPGVQPPRIGRLRRRGERSPWRPSLGLARHRRRSRG